MKKLLILIIITIFLTGCYDNIELNNLAIITGIGIDYKDNNFYLTYEILNDIKTDENSTMLSYTLSGQGKTISEAFINTNYKVGKKPYFDHLKIVLLSESIINGELDKITDYLLRDTDIRDEFILMVTKDNYPEEILSHNSKNNPVVTDLIMDLVDNEKYNNNLAIDENYQNVLAKLIGDKCDIVLGSITINEEDEITLDNFFIFNGYNYKSTLNKKNSSLYNLLNKRIFALEVDNYYHGQNVTININRSKTNIEVEADKIIINSTLEGKILENSANLDLEEEKTYQKLNKDFGQIIKNEIIEFIKILQENNSDILGFQDIYYKKTRKDNYNLWQKAKIEVNVNLKINTKGFIFEVANEK